jgi:hypothetical protein
LDILWIWPQNCVARSRQMHIEIRHAFQTAINAYACYCPVLSRSLCTSTSHILLKLRPAGSENGTAPPKIWRPQNTKKDHKHIPFGNLT